MRFPTYYILIPISVIALTLCGCATVKVVQETDQTAGSQRVETGRDDTGRPPEKKTEPGQKEAPADSPKEQAGSQDVIDNDTGEEMGEEQKSVELIKLVDSREEAEKIAKMYNIELVEFSFGLASYHTDEDPYEVIGRGIENGWPELSFNAERDLYNGKGNYQLY